MGAWRTDFVLDLGPGPDAATAFRTNAHPWWRRFVPGVYVRVDGDRVTAFRRDFSHHQTRPVLRGRLVTDATGARVEGRLSWALQKAWPLIFVFATMVFAWGAVVAARDGSTDYALTFVGCAVVGLALAGWARHDEARERLEHERDLREALLELLDR